MPSARGSRSSARRCEVPADAPLQDRLLGLIGRDPGLDPQPSVTNLTRIRCHGGRQLASDARAGSGDGVEELALVAVGQVVQGLAAVALEADGRA